jgi:RNA polymerase sigma-70 factor (ECF subfamily)
MNEDFRDAADEVLVGQAKAGRIDAYAELVRRIQEKIYGTIYGLTRNHEDADDLTQETFMYAYKAINGFEQKSSFYTWAYRIAVNLTLNFLKKKGREKGRESFDDNIVGLDLPAGTCGSSPEGNSLQKELQDKLDEAIGKLPLGYRAAFNLVTIQGMSHGRAAEILGCSENTVSWRMHKARKLLQAHLKPYFQAVRHGL